MKNIYIYLTVLLLTFAGCHTPPPPDNKTVYISRAEAAANLKEFRKKHYDDELTWDLNHPGEPYPWKHHPIGWPYTEK